MLCPNCGAAMTEGDRFCTACGNALPTSAAQPQQYAAPQPQQYAAPQPQQYAAPQPQQYAPQQQYAPEQQQQYAAQPYGYPQAAVPAKPKNKLLLPLLIGGSVLLIGVGLLLYFLVFRKDGGGSSGAVKTDPQQIACDVACAYYVDDYTKIAPYTPIDLYDGIRKQIVEYYGSVQAYYDMVREEVGYNVNSIQSMLEAQRDFTDNNAKERFGNDYKVTATLNEGKCSTYTGSEVASVISSEGSYCFEVADVSILEGVNVSDITELRIYYYDMEISGSMGSDETWYKIYMGQINGAWKLLGIY